MKTIKINKKNIDQRLDMFLSEKLKMSRSQTQKLINSPQIIVNKKQKTSHYVVQENDDIKFVKITKEEKKKIQGKLPKLNIISETDDYLVIEKSAGVIVHSGNGIEELTLVDAIEKKYPEIKKVGEDRQRPGIVHRLDKDTSGLMVIAKNNKIFNHLKEQFQERKVTKKYLALVYGAMEHENGEIDFPISRSVKGYKMAAHTKTQGGRRAITEFKIEQKFINYTLLDVKIKTGRTHQIRVHMSAYGYPIVGDNLYSTRKTKKQNEQLKLNRLFLHAYKLDFNDLNNEWQEFTIKLPKKLKELLKKIK